MILLDTDTLTLYLNDHVRVVRRFESANEEPIGAGPTSGKLGGLNARQGFIEMSEVQKRKRIRTKAGDVFVFDVDDTRVAAGQIVLRKAARFPIYVVLFEPLLPRDAGHDLQEILASKILFVGGTNETRIQHGLWRIIGNKTPEMSRVPMPYFKVYCAGRDIVEDFNRQFVRDATVDDLRFYPDEVMFSPVAFDIVMKIHYGLYSSAEPMKNSHDWAFKYLSIEDARRRCAASPVASDTI